MQAASDRAAQKTFYQKLLWNQLFVMTDGNHSDSDQEVQTSEEDNVVRFVTLENGQIPIFTSVSRIFDKKVVKEDQPYLSLKGQYLFDVAKGFTFVLNPFSDHVKELVPAEIESILNGTIYDQIDKAEMENKKYQEFNVLFERACKGQEGLIHLDGYNKKNLNTSDKMRLEDSVKDFQKCLEILPDNWQSMILMAKAFQSLERHSEALEQLESAFKIELEKHTIPMEASLEAMHLNDFDKGLYYSEEALKRRPNDIALLGNHAMNLLLVQKDKEALDTIEKAIKIQPADSVNRNIESIIRDVISGERRRPTFEETIQ